MTSGINLNSLTIMTVIFQYETKGRWKFACFFKGYILNFDELSFIHVINVILADQLKNEIQMTQFLIK